MSAMFKDCTRRDFERIRPSGNLLITHSGVLTALIASVVMGVFVLGIWLFAVGFYNARILVVINSIEIATTVVASIFIGRILGNKFDLFEPVTVVNLMFLLYYTVRPIYLMELADINDPNSFVRANPAEAIDYAWAVGYAVLGLAIFHLGYYTKASSLCRAAMLQPQRVWSSRRVTQVAIIGGLWAMASAAMGIYAAGGIGGTLANIGRLREVTGGYAYGLLGTSFFATGTLLLLVDHLSGHPRTLWIVSFFALSVTYCTLNGDRTGVFTVILACVVIYAYIHRIKSYLRFTLWSIGIGSILVPLIVLWAVVRQTNTGVADFAPIAQTVVMRDSSILYAQLLDEFSAVDSFAAVLHGGRSTFPLQYGKTYLDVLLFVVPRGIWPNKPTAFSRAVGDYVTGNENDVPPGVIGELFANYHVFGIVAGMFLLGRLMGFVYWRANIGSGGSIAMYAILIPYFGVFLSRNFIGVGVMILTTIGPMWLAVLYIEGKVDKAPKIRQSFRGTRKLRFFCKENAIGRG